MKEIILNELFLYSGAVYESDKKLFEPDLQKRGIKKFNKIENNIKELYCIFNPLENKKEYGNIFAFELIEEENNFNLYISINEIKYKTKLPKIIETIVLLDKENENKATKFYFKHFKELKTIKIKSIYKGLKDSKKNPINDFYFYKEGYILELEEPIVLKIENEIN